MQIRTSYAINLFKNGKRTQLKIIKSQFIIKQDITIHQLAEDINEAIKQYDTKT